MGNEKSDRKPSDFDWVTARRQCSEIFVFEQLRREAEANVARRNEFPAGGQATISFNDDKYMFFVLREDIPRIRRWVRFESNNQDGEGIHITNSEDKTFIVHLALDDEGECKLSLGDDELLDRWQLLSRMLQGVLFP